MKSYIIGDKMKRPAFTLIELLVVAAVFSVLFLVGTGVYTSAFGRQKEVQAKQRVAAEARSALETIARSVRIGNVDYAYYRIGCGTSTDPARCDLTQSQPIIAVRDSTNVQTCFAVNSDQRLVTSTNCSQPVAGWTVMTPEDLIVTDFSSWVAPAADPFLGPPSAETDCRIQPPTPTLGFDDTAGVCKCVATASDCWSGQTCDAAVQICKNPNVQPTITVALTIQTLANAKFKATSRLQTTVVSRNYQR